MHSSHNVSFLPSFVTPLLDIHKQSILLPLLLSILVKSLQGIMLIVVFQKVSQKIEISAENIPDELDVKLATDCSARG